MSVQRYVRGGRVRYRARVKSHGREVATRVFDRKQDAVAWDQDQSRRLRAGDWVDPRRGKVTVASIHPEWEASRQRLKRKTREADASAWKQHIGPRFGSLAVASITAGEVSTWVGGLISGGLSSSTANRYLATLRSLLGYAVADRRVSMNVAATVKLPSGGRARREGQYLTVVELADLVSTFRGTYGEVALVLGLCGLRWGELAGLQVGDRVAVPGAGLRVQRAVLASSADGSLYVDSLKGRRARTVPLPAGVIPIVERWASAKASSDWLFHAPGGGPLSESNWKRAVGWSSACESVGRPKLRPHDLRHTAASIWLGAGADPKVVQRVLGHASAAMTMDLYGHLIDQNLWDAARMVGGTTGAPMDVPGMKEAPTSDETGA